MYSIKLSNLDKLVIKKAGKSKQERYSNAEVQYKIVIEYLQEREKEYGFTVEKIQNTKNKRTNNLIEIIKNGKKYLCIISTKKLEGFNNKFTLAVKAADEYSDDYERGEWYALLALIDEDKKVDTLHVIEKTKKYKYLKDEIDFISSGHTHYEVKMDKIEKIKKSFKEWLKGI